MRFALVFVAMAAFAQQPVDFEGLAALELANEKVSMTVTLDGATMTRFVLRDDAAAVNPLWDSIRQAREAGRDTAGITSRGHFVCVDGFGGVSPEERAAGLAGHGEAHLQRFDVVASRRSGNTAMLSMRAELPVVREVFTRTYRLVDGENVIYVDSELESLLGFDRPVVWAEHATIGDPFLAPVATVVDVSAGRAQTRPRERGSDRNLLEPEVDFTWPLAPMKDGTLRDMRFAPANPDLGDHVTVQMDPNRDHAFATTLNTEMQLLIGWVFRREDFPWVQSWENYQQGRTLARGLEFSTQPYDVPRRQSVSLNSMFGTPTYRWLPAKSKIESKFLIFYTRVPETFGGVSNVRLENGRIVIEDSRSGETLELAASRGL